MLLGWVNAQWGEYTAWGHGRWWDPQGGWGRLSHLQVGHGEDDRVHEKDTTGLLVDGRCDDLGVHHQGGATWATGTRFTR